MEEVAYVYRWPPEIIMKLPPNELVRWHKAAARIRKAGG